MAEAKRILVTGSAGFIGRAVCTLLQNSGHRLFKVDNLSSPAVYPVDPDTVRMDVRDLRVSDLDGIHGVIHLAAQKNVPLSFEDPTMLLHNVEVDAHLLRLVGRAVPSVPLLIAGSCEVYGIQSGRIPEGTPHSPQSPYAVAKAATEHLAGVYRRASPCSRITIIRLFNTYGAESGGGAVIAEFIDALRCGRPIVVEGDGKQRRDFNHVNEVVRAMTALLDMPQLPPVLNLGCGQEIAVIDIARTLVDIHGAGEIVHHPGRLNEIPSFAADTHRLASLGLVTRPRDVLADLVEIYRQRVEGFLDERKGGALCVRSPSQVTHASR